MIRPFQKEMKKKTGTIKINVKITVMLPVKNILNYKNS